MIKNKKQMFIVISVFALIMLLGTVSYAFFNYTRTGSENTVRVGRLSFVTNQTRTINLTDAFPIDSSNVNTDTDNVGEVVITISGDTDYVNGIEYLVSTEDVHIYTSEGKAIPVSLDVSVSGLGTESSTYFTSRNSKDTTIYKKLGGTAVMGEQQVLVGYIKPNTTSGTAEGINGSITIKAYFDNDKIAITDTIDESETWVDGRTYVTSEEWNSLSTNGVTFKIRVEANTGIWVGEPFYEVMTRSTVMDNINSTYVQNSTPGINLKSISSDTNGKGLYTLSKTADDSYPILYYRGDVDNNVLFGGFCWKIVRTTNTGGIKLIYNGNPVNNQCGEDRVLEKNQIIRIETSQVFNYTGSVGDSYEYDTTNKVFVLNNAEEVTLSSDNINSLVGKYLCNIYQATGLCNGIIKIHSYDSANNIVNFTQITQDSSIVLDNNDPNRDNVRYNLNEESLSSVGYMYGDVYSFYHTTPSSSQVYFGTGFIYENGVYKLTNPVKFSWSELSTHHYTCNSTDPNGTCESIRYYVILNNTGGKSYVSLTNGKGIEDAINDMFTNTHDSLAKIMVDTWYSEHMTNYTNKLEDTVFCNDRVINSYGGWNPNGGDTISDHSMSFSHAGINCKTKRDSFTVSSEKGNGKLDYPVGLLMYEESNLAGTIYGLNNPNTDFYLYDGNGGWTMTPNTFEFRAFVERFYAEGNHGGTRVDHTGYMSGFRPVISLKEGTSMISGNGTPTNPYIVK